MDHPHIFRPRQWRIAGHGMATWFHFWAESQTKVCLIFITMSVKVSDISSRNFAMAASMIMNSNSLPIALLQALALSVPGLEWYQDDTVDSITGRALTYLFLCGTVGQLVSSFYDILFRHPPPTNRSAGAMAFNYSPRHALRTTSIILSCLAVKLAH